METIEPRYLIIAGEVNAIMCEEHAKVFELMMMTGELPHTIIELEDEDSDKKCQACNLLPDIVDNMPRIILPGDYH